MNLYHGTTERRLRSIAALNMILPALTGTKTVSFSMCPEVAAYFAANSCSMDDCDEGRPVILTTTKEKLLEFGVDVSPYSDAVWGEGECAWEKEMASFYPVPFGAVWMREWVNPPTYEILQARVAA